MWCICPYRTYHWHWGNRHHTMKTKKNVRCTHMHTNTDYIYTCACIHQYLYIWYPTAIIRLCKYTRMYGYPWAMILVIIYTCVCKHIYIYTYIYIYMLVKSLPPFGPMIYEYVYVNLVYVYKHNTMRCRYSAVCFLKNPHERHPIARPLGRAIGCLLWLPTLIHILLRSVQRCLQYHVMLDCVITTFHCIYHLFCHISIVSCFYATALLWHVDNRPIYQYIATAVV